MNLKYKATSTDVVFEKHAATSVLLTFKILSSSFVYFCHFCCYTLPFLVLKTW